jgi:hypothetical protein
MGANLRCAAQSVILSRVNTAESFAETVTGDFLAMITKNNLQNIIHRLYGAFFVDYLQPARKGIHQLCRE